jgi:hypothetical protein
MQSMVYEYSKQALAVKIHGYFIHKISMAIMHLYSFKEGEFGQIVLGSF